MVPGRASQAGGPTPANPQKVKGNRKWKVVNSASREGNMRREIMESGDVDSNQTLKSLFKKYG